NFPGIYCLKIKSFNKKTADDLEDYIISFNQEAINLLILDLRNNPGGPPLAVRQLSGMFMPEHTKLVYYEKKNTPEFGITTPSSGTHYKGTMIILINKNSGSACEILAAAFKRYKRAILMGKEPTAGQAFLKSTFKLKDGSMLAMITGSTYLFDGTPISMGGIKPDYLIPQDIDDVLGFTIYQFQRGQKPKDK
ncbi:MAG: S41 family peptidase, partial [Candidatus Omnitrophota bacterium]